MKTSSFLFLSTAAGVALAALAGAEFTASIPAEIVIAAGTSLAIIGLMIADYRRYVRPITGPVARVLPPAVPAVVATRPPHTLAYGVRRQSAIIERAA
ncbi:MAG: hypothetical protein C0502_09210 [Opitutus sp.]|nr:hypothetical protein [Opitutus sp.]